MLHCVLNFAPRVQVEELLLATRPNEIRDMLTARGLEKKGLKKDLIARCVLAFNLFIRVGVGCCCQYRVI